MRSLYNRLVLPVITACVLSLVIAGSVAAYKLEPSHWPSPATTMYVGMGSPWDKTLITAMGFWSDRTAFKFSSVNDSWDPCSAPNTSAVKNGTKFSDTFCGDHWGSGTLAVTLTWYSDTRTVQSGIVFNSNYKWNVYDGPFASGQWSGVEDFQRIAVHELGHVIGLNHEDSVPSIMSTYVLTGSNITTPQADDIAGVSALYGGSTPPQSNPTVTSISPSSGTKGANVAVTITGTGFVTGSTTVSISGNGAPVSLSITNVSVTNSTSLAGVLVIPASAPTGTYCCLNVAVSGGSTVSSSVTFTVTSPPAPTITSVSPRSGVQGTTVLLTISGTNFITGATTVALSGSGATIGYAVSVSNINVTSSTSLTAVATIGTATPAGVYSLSVSTAGGLASGPSFTVTTPDLNSTPFRVSDRGVVSLATKGNSGAAVLGYANVVPAFGSTAPSGLAIYGFKQNGIFINEVGVPASAPLYAGRIYAEVNAPVYTGVAMVNPNNQTANLSFYFTDSDGDFGNATTTIPANGQITGYLDQPPFNARSGFKGSFTFVSSIPISVVAIRGLNNERNEFLAATLPVIDLNAPPSTGTLMFPEFAAGGGYKTQVVLVNPSDSVLAGTIRFRDSSGKELSSPSYRIAAHASQNFHIDVDGTSLTLGSASVIPSSGSATPSGVALVSLNHAGTTEGITGFPGAAAGTAFRLYAETSGDFNHNAVGSIQTGVAVVNTSTSDATVTMELFNSDGSSTGFKGTMPVPAMGQTSFFLNQVQAFASLQTPFRGMLRVSSAAPISVIGIRGRFNERTDFLTTITPSVNEATLAPTGPLYFPQVVDGGGYSTQFILFSGQPGPTSSGTLQLFTRDGAKLNLTLSNP